MTGKRLPHDPRKRMCSLASLTTFVFDGDELVDWQYREPAGGVRRCGGHDGVAAAMLAGCSTGDDAVAQGGTFEFVAPGGKTDIVYDPPASRGSRDRYPGRT